MILPNNTDFLFLNEPARLTAAYLEPVLLHAHSLEASDITLQSEEPIFIERYGKLQVITQRRLSHHEIVDMLHHIYGSNGNAQILSGSDIDTHYEFRRHRRERYRFRVNATGCLVNGHHGIQITFRAIPTTPPILDTLDLEPELKDALSPEQGVVYVTGPTGSGKSTLLAAIIRELAGQAQGHRKILTYESPIEFVYDNIDKPNSIISQVEIPKHLPSFAAGVINALRRNPRLILVGEARDPETISAVIEAALTGHPVYTTLHSQGVPETMRRLITALRQEELGSMMDIIETMRVIICQKLIPTLDGKRIAIREFLVFDQPIRHILLDTPLEKVTMKTRALLKQYGQPLAVDVERKFKLGLISEYDKKRLTIDTDYAVES